MNVSISLDSIMAMLSGLSTSNKQWIAAHLMEQVNNAASVKKEETEYISKEEVLAGIDAGLKDLKAGRMMSFDQMLQELEAYECNY